MAKTTTEQAQNSKDKGIIQNIGFKEFATICGEYRIVEKATKELLEIASNIDTSERGKIEIYKWIIEMRIGKAKQMTDITLQGEDDKGLKGIVIDYVDDHIEKEALEKKLIEKGMTTDEIENYARDYVYEYRKGHYKISDDIGGDI